MLWTPDIAKRVIDRRVRGDLDRFKKFLESTFGWPGVWPSCPSCGTRSLPASSPTPRPGRPCASPSRETEAPLVELARYTTAAQLDRIARARANVHTGDEAENGARRREARHLHWFWDDDGSLVLTARLDADEGALVLQALDAGDHALRDQAAGGDLSTEIDDAAASSRPAETPADDSVTTARRHNAEAARVPFTRADALVAMAETILAHGPTARDGGERYQVVVIVAHDTLAGANGGGEVDDGPFVVSEAARRLACDSTVVAMSLDAGGEPLSVGRATPTIPRHIRRALRKRDGGCRFPGCSQRRFVDGHHIVHWGSGGETSLANLCMLCRHHHHHAVHEGGFGLRRTPAGELVFTTPAGVELRAAPEVEPVTLDVDDVNHRLGVVIGTGTGACLWGGERLDLGLTVDALLCLEGRIGA